MFPLETSVDGRFLVDRNGRPWRVQADAAFRMATNAQPAEVEQYLRIRRRQGFNSFYLQAIVHAGGISTPNAPNNWRGDPPFEVPGDFSTAGTSERSERYWSWLDWIIETAHQHGMAVMLSYTYLGWGGDAGWQAEILGQQSRDALFEWGEWLGSRYQDSTNLLWFGLGDFSPSEGSELALRTAAIAQGIRSAGASQLCLAEAEAPDSLPSEVPDFQPFVDMNSFYGYGPEGGGAVYQTARRAWRHLPVMPAWMQEATFEFENNWGKFSGKSWETRRGRFWSVLGGGTAGDGFGSRDVWQWKRIPESLDTPGAEYSQHAFDLFSSMPWWSLRPSGCGRDEAGLDLIVRGGGDWGDLDYVAAAVTADGHWLLAYVPVTRNRRPRTFTVDISLLTAPARAQWFDPSSGARTTIEGVVGESGASNVDFTTPGRRRDRTNDWLLVLNVDVDAPCDGSRHSGRFTTPMV